MASKIENNFCLEKDINYTHHWNEAYSKTKTEKLGWFEKEAIPTLQLINATNVSKDATILNIGVGSSTLIDDLIAANFTDIIANDISSKAILSLKERLGSAASKVDFILDDVTNSKKLINLREIDIWNDRAVLHFFLLEKEKKAYIEVLKKLLKKGGYAIIAAFSLEGAKKCCGLNIQQYNSESLATLLGNDFELQQTFNHTFVNPNGDYRPYVYTLFKRVKK